MDIQRVLARFNRDRNDGLANWYAWREYDDNGERIPNAERMKFEHVVVTAPTAVMPSREEFDAMAAVILAEDVRLERDRLLRESDWASLPDVPASEAWLAYRQALRDVPQQSGFPDDVDWPTPPNE